MATRVGALLVMSDGKLAGIISNGLRAEGDTAGKIRGHAIREIMTSPVISVILGRVDECMELMTRNRIRHLPIMENNGDRYVSIGDR